MSPLKHPEKATSKRFHSRELQVTSLPEKGIGEACALPDIAPEDLIRDDFVGELSNEVPDADKGKGTKCPNTVKGTGHAQKLSFCSTLLYIFK